MVLSRVAQIEGQQVHLRMVWYDIRKDSLSWNWERSLDEGRTREALWVIDYVRAR